MRLFSLLLTLSFLAAPLSATTQVLPVRELAAPDWDRGGEDDLFGYALANDGNRLIVGIPGIPTTSAPGMGMVEIYEPSLSSYSLVQRLLPTQNDADEKFGIALAINDDDLAVGSWDAGFGAGLVAGSVHMYRREAGEWQFVARLVAPEVDSGDGFGSRLALNPDWLAITAPGFDDQSGRRGAVFLYRREGDSWNFFQRIDNSEVGSGFACSMAMTATRLLIGDCLGDSIAAEDSGTVLWYELDASGAIFGGTIAAADSASGDNFGYEIAAVDSHVVIAAVGASPHPNRVYFFEQAALAYEISSVLPLPSFAVSLHIIDDRALIAGPVCASTTTPGRNVSCVRRLDWIGNAWIEAAPYTQQPEVGFNGFGIALTVANNQIHAGNPFRDVAAGPSSGAISYFDIGTPEIAPNTLELPPGLWRFAFNTVVDGNLLVASDSRLGTPDQFNEGTAWVYDISSALPQLLARIDNPEPYTYERFGSGVGVAGDRIVLSTGKRVPGGSTLALRTYQRNGASVDFIDEFNPFELAELNGIVLRTSLQLNADRLVLEGTVATTKGFAPKIIVLARAGNTWILEDILSPPAQDEQIAINFSRMAMHEDRIVLLRGELQPLLAEPRSWVAFVYRRGAGTWNLETSLRPASGEPPAMVLYDIDIHGGEIALTTADTLGNVLHSRIYSFRFDGANWQALQRIDAPADTYEFGRQVTIENGFLVVESFPTMAISGNFVTPLRLYRAEGDSWQATAGFLPMLAPAGAGRVLDFGSPQLRDGRLFAAGRREGPGVSTHTHGVVFEFDVSDPVFADAFE